MSKGGFHLGSLYCHSGIGITAAPNLKLLGEVAATLRGIDGPWILGCDANCTPKALADTGWVELVGGAIHAPDQPTCNDKVYDFFIVSRNCSHAVRRVATIADAECKPHHPTRIWIDARPRNDLCRKLANLGKFDAWLPFGPQRAEHYAAAPDLEAQEADPGGAIIEAWKQYAGTITEVDLNDVNHAPQFIEASDLAQEEVRYRAFLAADPCHGKVRHGIAIRRGSLQHGARECLQLDVLVCAWMCGVGCF